jgi:hypothetical protein
VPDPPPWTLIVEPGHAAMYSLAAASTTGCMAVEPAVVMLPVSHDMAAAEPAADGSPEAPADAGATEAAVVAAADGEDPLLEQAPRAIDASRTSAPRRFGAEIVTFSILLKAAQLGCARSDMGTVP